MHQVAGLDWSRKHVNTGFLINSPTEGISSMVSYLARSCFYKILFLLAENSFAGVVKRTLLLFVVFVILT